jgi:hypothetical protein
MTIHKRRMKDYHPRKRATSAEKQKLSDLHRRMSMNVGALLVLFEEGNPQQIAMAGQKAKMDLLKYGPEMLKLSQTMGGTYARVVENYLHSIDNIVHSAAGWVDEAKITHCYHMTQEIERLIA